MKTKTIKVGQRDAFLSEIKPAAEVINAGGLVAFPTETVYGLGADALNATAVKRIYEVKNRQIDNPLIVHISDKEEVYRVAKSEEVSDEAKKLINLLWPGPLTIVVKKANIVPDITTAGLDTVAIRMPRHEVALNLIRESGVPIAAPSANLAGKPSPTSAAHVIQDLYGKIDVIIDAGRTEIGVESTVIDLTGDMPTVLRPGGVTLEDLQSILDRVKLHPSISISFGEKEVGDGFIARSPGMKYKHYAPNADVIVVEGKEKEVRDKIRQFIAEKEGERKIGVMTTYENKGKSGNYGYEYNYDADIVKFVGADLDTIARNLFKTFREMDEDKVDIIIAESVEESGLGRAIMNRLKKAAGYKVIKA
jgi:L-threonylcarbamoyladenylate synthase